MRHEATRPGTVPLTSTPHTRTTPMDTHANTEHCTQQTRHSRPHGTALHCTGTQHAEQPTGAPSSRFGHPFHPSTHLSSSHPTQLPPVSHPSISPSVRLPTIPSLSSRPTHPVPCSDSFPSPLRSSRSWAAVLLSSAAAVLCDSQSVLCSAPLSFLCCRVVSCRSCRAVRAPLWRSSPLLSAVVPVFCVVLPLGLRWQ